MTAFAILRVAKLKSLASIRASAVRVLSEGNMPGPAVGPGTGKAVVDVVRARVALADRAHQNPVLAIEYLVTGSPEIRHWPTARRDAYFAAAIEWLRERHGDENLVFARVLTDKATPYLVAYAVPLVERPAHTIRRSVNVGGRGEGGELRREVREVHLPAKVSLSASRWLGGPITLSRMQYDFAEKVGKRFGLERGVKDSRARHSRVRAPEGAGGGLGILRHIARADGLDLVVNR